ncbi:hypothetical protein RSAG8_13928, partial [Rhizoctonia solani AG-8 WAC10335]
NYGAEAVGWEDAKSSNFLSYSLIMFFEGPLFPCIFVMSTKNMGRHTRRASSLLIAAISGGAVFPPIQGAIADKHGTRISFALCIPAFAYTAGFGFWLWVRHGAHFNLHHEKMAQVEPAFEAVGHKSLNLHEKGGFDERSSSQIQDVREDELKEKV